MNINKITSKDLDDIFSIPRDMSHLNSNEDSHDVSYADSAKDVGSSNFSDQIKKVSSMISEVIGERDGDDSLSKVSVDCNHDLNDNIHDASSPVDSVKDDNNNDADTKDKKNYSEENHKMSDDSFTWNFNSDDDTFDHFYEEKKSAITGWLLPFGEIDFKAVVSELNNAKVNLSSLNYGDFHQIFSIMKEIQQWRDRVSQIAIRTNAQYYPWKRAVELFTGLLAQYKYEKPATKQDGLVYRHMGDMISYYSQLESTHRSVEIILKNLDNAFECLSRQVTISMPGRDHEDVAKKASDRMSEKNVNNKDYGSKTDLSDSDKKILSDLDTVSSSKPVKSKKSIKTGKVDWNGNF